MAQTRYTFWPMMRRLKDIHFPTGGIYALFQFSAIRQTTITFSLDAGLTMAFAQSQNFQSGSSSTEYYIWVPTQTAYTFVLVDPNTDNAHWEVAESGTVGRASLEAALAAGDSIVYASYVEADRDAELARIIAQGPATHFYSVSDPHLVSAPMPTYNTGSKVYTFSDHLFLASYIVKIPESKLSADDVDPVISFTSSQPEPGLEPGCDTILFPVANHIIYPTDISAGAHPWPWFPIRRNVNHDGTSKTDLEIRYTDWYYSFLWYMYNENSVVDGTYTFPVRKRKYKIGDDTEIYQMWFGTSPANMRWNNFGFHITDNGEEPWFSDGSEWNNALGAPALIVSASQ
jgi:hypothetical protein